MGVFRQTAVMRHYKQENSTLNCNNSDIKSNNIEK